MNKITKFQKRVLEALAGKLEGFYLAGGTALSMFYFNHRDSYGLDFFSQKFIRSEVEEIVSELGRALKTKIILEAEQAQRNRARQLVYGMVIDKAISLKVDFVQDIHKLIKPLVLINGIPVLSKEDIYLRKLCAVAGSFEASDETGNKIFGGGRQEAKDFFDLYFLSTTFMSLSKFAARYCPWPQQESIVVWYNTYDRMVIKSELTEIITEKKIDYRDMDRHFRSEIKMIVQRAI